MITDIQKVGVAIEAKEERFIPTYTTEEAAGADLRACIGKDTIRLKPGRRVIVPTGVFIQLPRGTEAQIRSRSGLAAKFGIKVLNSPGTIDSDYRGEIKVILFNTSEETFVINDGDRIAQMVIAPYLKASFLYNVELAESERGKGGLGHTGVK